MRSAISAKRQLISAQIDAKLTAKSYVQNGLILQFDSLENAGYNRRDDSITAWTNLVDRTDYAKDISFTNSIGMKFQSIPRISVTNRRRYLYMDHDFTLHGCLVVANTYWGNWVQIGIGCGGANQNGIAFSAENNKYAVQYRERYGGPIICSVPTGTTLGQACSIDIAFDYANKTYYVYIDGEAVGEATIPEESWNLDNKQVYVYFPLFYYVSEDFEVFDVMLYGRCLSEDEIKHNAHIDRERYGL